MITSCRLDAESPSAPGTCGIEVQFTIAYPPGSGMDVRNGTYVSEFQHDELEDAKAFARVLTRNRNRRGVVVRRFLAGTTTRRYGPEIDFNRTVGDAPTSR